MKGLGCTVPGKEVGWIEKPKPTPGPFDAVARPLLIAPCTSDVHNAYALGAVASMQDRILGHESLAEIVEVGSLVKDFKPGDKVVVPAVTPDWRSPDVEDNLPQHAGRIMSGFQFAFKIDGVMAEYFLIPDVDMNVALIPEGIAYERAIMASDMMTTGLYGTELADIQFGDSVAVIGIGPVGLMAVAGAKLRGAGRIFVVGTRQNCIDIAMEYGATQVVSYKEGAIDRQIRALTNKKGVDKVILAGGDEETFGQAINMVKPGGTVANINMFTGISALPIPLLGWGSGLGNKTLQGGLCPGGRRRMERMLALLQHNRIDPSKMITHTFKGLEGSEAALQLMADKPRDLIKPIVYVD